MRWKRLVRFILFLNLAVWPAWAADDQRVPKHFPLRVAESGTYLVDSSGRPFLVHGDTAWSLIAQLTREEVEIYLTDRKARGFNALLVNLIEHQFAANAPANIYGDRPFVGDRPFRAMNDAYFDHAAWVLRRAEEMGFAVFLAPVYLGVNGGEEGWYRDAAEAGVPMLRRYAQYIVRRFADRDNIVWVHGGDFNPPEKALVDAVASTIKDFAPDALQTVHLSRETLTIDQWGDEDWLSLLTAYTYQDAYAAVLAQAHRTPARPVILIEGLYEGEHGADDATIRRQAYGALLAGAAGHFFGNSPIWRFDEPGSHPAETGWRAMLGSPGAQSVSHLCTLFEDLPWWLLSTGQQLPRMAARNWSYDASVSNGAISIGYMTGEDNQELHVRQGDRTISIEWFDPASGRRYRPVIYAPDESGVLLPPANRNATGQRDWVFLLRAEE